MSTRRPNNAQTAPKLTWNVDGEREPHEQNDVLNDNGKLQTMLQRVLAVQHTKGVEHQPNVGGD